MFKACQKMRTVRKVEVVPKKMKSCQKVEVMLKEVKSCQKSRSRAKKVEVVPKKLKSCKKSRSRAKKGEVVPKSWSRAKKSRSRAKKVEVVLKKLKYRIPQYKYELFHTYFTWFHYTGRNELNKLTLLPMCGFIAQLVEHRTGIAEVMGSNPVEALIFFRLLLSNCLNWKIYCDDHTSRSSHTAVQLWIISYIFHMISLHGKKWTQ